MNDIAARKPQQRNDRDQEASARAKCDWLDFASLCRDNRCRRHRRCRGDARACWERHWATLPEDFKNHLRLTIEYSRSMPWQAAAERAVMEMAQRKQAEADLAARLAAPAERIALAAPRARRL